MSESGLLNSFVWMSSKESRDAGKVSVLAIVETILSVAGCWLLVSWTGLYWVLLTSVVLAFLVLLRSLESIAKGRDMFTAYWDRDQKQSKAEIAVILVLSAATAGVTMWLLASHWLDGESGWDLFTRSVFLGWLANNIGVMIGVTIGGVKRGVIKTPAAAATAIAAAGAAAVAAVVATAGAAAGAGVLTGVLAGLLAAIAAGATAIAAAAAVAGAVVLAVAGAGMIFGVALRAIAVRFWATFCHLHKGIPRFAENWTTVTFNTDLFTPPELIPGFPEEHPFTFNRVLHQFRPSDPPDKYLFLFICLVVFYVPSLLYRYYLKSTAWLYFPLIWLVHVPRGIRNEDGKLKWDRSHGRSLLDLIVLLIAVLVLAFFVLVVIDWEAVQRALESVVDGTGLPVHPMLMLAGIDFAKLNIWYWIPTLSAFFTLVTFLWSNKLQVYAAVHTDFHPPQWKVWTIFKLNSAKNWLTISWIFVGVYTLVFAFYDVCRLPEAASPLLELMFGPKDCQHAGP